MKTSIATVCVSGNLQEKLEAIAAAGFKAVEIFENDLIAFPGSPRDVRRICADLGLQIVTCQPFRDFEGMPAEKRQRTFDRAERKFDLLEELGTDMLFVCSSVAPDAQGGIERIAGDFRELGERAGKRGLRVGYEALAWGRHINDYRDSWEVVRRADHPSVGLILDTFHILARELETETIRRIPGDRIAFVQIADAPKLQMDYLSWARHWRCLPGQGDFDLSGFMDALRDTGYDGPLSLEIFNDRFRAGSARSVALDGHRSLIWLMDESARRSGRAPAASPLPPPAPVEDVEFIEFTVDEADRKAFETMLSAMGFAKVGAHRSKDVALWRQGAIRFVVNSDKEGFAHSYQITHGTSVCALAFKVPDARAIIARAKGLLDVPHQGAVGPGELDIPAVRGLGGSLVYFTDDASGLGRWADVDFEPVAATLPDAGLTAVDHISQTMQYEEMLTWLLFYTSLLDARKTPSEAVLDPGGVVQSQVVESGLGGAHDGLRLVLNGSQSHRTLSARFVTDFFGSGVQHIALRTADIRATIARMAAAGVDMLPIPENYYDDLEARTDLSAADIDALKALNILYDRDQGGTFHQAYTTTLDGGFFFEIVQRDGYAGYGAPNAGVRLAAQARLARPAAMPSS
jgi:4-hydroxyphenylpyruvate dioxygenase